MATLKEWEAAYNALNSGVLALGELIDARAAGNEDKAKAAIDTMSLELGRCSDALRVIRPPLM